MSDSDKATREELRKITTDTRKLGEPLWPKKALLPHCRCLDQFRVDGVDEEIYSLSARPIPKTKPFYINGQLAWFGYDVAETPETEESIRIKENHELWKLSH